ncbi:molecular chaperone HscC [Clostridium cavendishii DSM 21758]|uniref:Chaperone protein DnaK n=1 Tax=Clostridium cavendishii DSM 21758 TaxID=1121302 RepID=A0A1M6VAB8_9CLOT|nr:molecular chaperone HscC [Clostridium cavendishii]SHK78432.1 molecular chaperone HscC [Clostridium cavendishii DSM 21758]
MAIIGIDLGTTNSLVAYLNEDGAKLIPNVLGENITPSVVGVDDNGEILVGKVAKERLITHPGRTVSNFKRFMGTKKKFNLGDLSFSPEELSSFILSSLKADAEAFLKEDITEAVISVPAYFNDAQRKATKRAAEFAGLKVERLISEPTAAALAYGIQNEDESQFLVFDLGGGTFDISILEMFEGVIEVKSIAGDNYLGGEDFNNLLVNYFLEKNNLQSDKLNKKELSQINKQAEKCKKELSYKNESTMEVMLNEEKLKVEITKNQSEAIFNELIVRIKAPIERALKDAELSTRDLDNIILIGGATRMPIIRSVVSKIFSKIPFCNINPDETVALGAAIQGGLKARKSMFKEVILTDVCPFTLGVEVVESLENGSFEDGYFLPLIERNTPIPVSKVERLYAVHKKQRIINIKVYQGESRKVCNNLFLGELKFDFGRRPREEKAIDVRYTYDINGLLEVEVIDALTKKKESMVIENSPGSLTKEEIDAILENLKDLKIHPRDRMENRLILAQGERMYEESLGEKRKYISALLISFEQALQTQDNKIISKAREELKNRLKEIEEF